MVVSSLSLLVRMPAWLCVCDKPINFMVEMWRRCGMREVGELLNGFDGSDSEVIDVLAHLLGLLTNALVVTLALA